MSSRRATAKKTYNLPPDLIDRAKRILKARTETEAIIRSLEEVAFMAEVESSVRASGGALPSFHRSK
jgi:hypothetical protein